MILKNITSELISFDYQGEAKIILPGEQDDLETNSYLDGLIALGRLQEITKTDKKQNGLSRD